MTLAFAIWATNFFLGYAVVLVDASLWGRIVLAIAGLISIPAFVLIWRQASGRDGERMVEVAVVISFLATLFNALVSMA